VTGDGFYRATGDAYFRGTGDARGQGVPVVIVPSLPNTYDLSLDASSRIVVTNGFGGPVMSTRYLDSTNVTWPAWSQDLALNRLFVAPPTGIPPKVPTLAVSFQPQNVGPVGNLDPITGPVNEPSNKRYKVTYSGSFDYSGYAPTPVNYIDFEMRVNPSPNQILLSVPLIAPMPATGVEWLSFFIIVNFTDPT